MTNMVKYFITLALIVSVGIVASAQDVAKKKVAVYMTGSSVDENYKKVIASKLVTGITRSDSYTAVERTADFLSAISAEEELITSGELRDSQIAALGQKFGVRYVLVADISEVFESMFISARMIDVETAQITNSTETSGAVNNIESLYKLAENIVLEIVGVPSISEDAIKQNSVSTFDDLYYCYAPSGYHIATYDEIVKIIKNHQMTGKKVYYPIYTDVRHTNDMLKQVFTVDCYKNNKQSSKIVKTYTDYRYYNKYYMTCRLTTSSTESTALNLDYIDDSNYASSYTRNNRPATSERYRTVSHGLIDMGTPKPNITPGYVWFIKNE